MSEKKKNENIDNVNAVDDVRLFVSPRLTEKGMLKKLELSHSIVYNVRLLYDGMD